MRVFVFNYKNSNTYFIKKIKILISTLNKIETCSERMAWYFQGIYKVK